MVAPTQKTSRKKFVVQLDMSHTHIAIYIVLFCKEEFGKNYLISDQ